MSLSPFAAALAAADAAAICYMGADITYTPIGGAPVTIKGVFGLRDVTAGVDAEGVGFIDRVPTLRIRSAELSANPTRGDTVVVNDTTYRVAGSEIDPEAATVVLMLELA